MSIKHQMEINELRARVERLERFMNKVNNEPYKVAGKPVEYKERKKPGPKPGWKKAKAEQLESDTPVLPNIEGTDNG